MNMDNGETEGRKGMEGICQLFVCTVTKMHVDISAQRWDVASWHDSSRGLGLVLWASVEAELQTPEYLNCEL